MIGINTIDYSADGAITFEELPNSSFRKVTTRMNRTFTLDGGAVFDHFGVIDADLTFDIRANLDQTISDRLWNIYRSQTLIKLSCKDGSFTGMINQIEIDNGKLKMSFLVKESA